MKLRKDDDHRWLLRPAAPEGGWRLLLLFFFIPRTKVDVADAAQRINQARKPAPLTIALLELVDLINDNSLGQILDAFPAGLHFEVLLSAIAEGLTYECCRCHRYDE
ncbi:uncharacterized protein J3R85_001342 [Psidium guajava]|nr:uncharacterized protein J3R85_001342 [Psidium guajava]